MQTRWFSAIAIRLLGVAVGAASVDCGSTGHQGFAPEADAGASAYPSFGGSSPAVWSMPFGGGAVTPHSVAVGADGTVRIAGTLSGLATIGPVSLASAGGSDVLLAKLDAGGDVLWARNYGDAQDQSATAVAVDTEGNVVVVGTFAGTLDLSASQPVLQSITVPPSGTAAAPAPSTASLHAFGVTDAFVAKLDPNGALLWNVQFGGAGATAQALAVTIGPNGEVALTGAYVGTLGDLGSAAA